jgi:hypothetical protein
MANLLTQDAERPEARAGAGDRLLNLTQMPAADGRCPELPEDAFAIGRRLTDAISSAVYRTGTRRQLAHG